MVARIPSRICPVQILGIDIGGTGIKGAPVDTDTGVLIQKRFRLKTPERSTPEAVASVVASIVEEFEWRGMVGCGFPGVVADGVVLTAANVSKKWVGTASAKLFQEATGCPFVLINDADAAGVAEMRFGAGRDSTGVALMLTLGTGIGTALFQDRKLVPNFELGQLEIDGRNAEKWASARARDKDGLSAKRWGKRVNAYLRRLHAHFWPELIILGGGGSKNFDALAPYLSVPRCEVVPAKLLNRAGIVGAALAALPPPDPPID